MPKTKIMIWKIKPSLEILNGFMKNTLVEHLGIEIIEVGDDYLKGSMPVDHRTVQPFRLLHGGASVALAESLGSIASNVVIGDPKKATVGLEVNANHLKSGKEGETVIGTVKPIRLGKRIHVWNIEITNENEELLCVSRLTVAILA